MSVADITADWKRYQHVSQESGFLGRFSAGPALAPQVRARLLSAADAVIVKYRDSSDPGLANYEWSKARTALQYALEIDPSDRESRGRLALCDGYLNLIRNPKLPKADPSETNFQIAAADLPPSARSAFGTRLFVHVRVSQCRQSPERVYGGRTPRVPARSTRITAGGEWSRLPAAEYEIRQARRAAELSSAPEERRWLSQAVHDLDREVVSRTSPLPDFPT